MTRLATFALAATIAATITGAHASDWTCNGREWHDNETCTPNGPVASPPLTDIPLTPNPISLDRSWHLLTQSYGGTVSLIRDLTKHECEFARTRVLGIPAGDEQHRAGGITVTTIPGPGTIRSAECFQ